MSDRDAEHTLTELQEARAEVDLLRLEVIKLRQLILDKTSVTCHGQRYWPEWVNKYFESTCREVSDNEL
jgi:hypothetical protein